MKMKVLILGYGEMGHALEYLLRDQQDVRIWSRSGTTVLEEEAALAQAIFFCLPVNAHFEIVRKIAPHLKQHSLCLSIAKGLDESGLAAAQIFSKVLLPNHHFGVLYGPMIAEEIMMGRHAFANVANSRQTDYATVYRLFMGTRLVCVQADDMLGCSWSVILKNVYAIIFGVSDELKLGDNMRGYLMVTALAELSDIVKSFGSNANTPFSYAGLGDLLTTATSENSHHHELGRNLAKGNLSDISGEGVHTLKMIEKFQLFDTQRYPLFTLISTVVAQPQKLRNEVERYLKSIQGV